MLFPTTYQTLILFTYFHMFPVIYMFPVSFCSCVVFILKLHPFLLFYYSFLLLVIFPYLSSLQLQTYFLQYTLSLPNILIQGISIKFFPPFPYIFNSLLYNIFINFPLLIILHTFIIYSVRLIY